MKIIVSACLLGVPCRYNGESKPDEQIQSLVGQHEIIPVCPEQFGGLQTPRPPSEIKSGRVFTNKGEDVTEPFIRGAQITAQLARLFGATHAILKNGSPSCGVSRIYDGSFSKQSIEGKGFAAEALSAEGLILASEEDWMTMEF